MQKSQVMHKCRNFCHVNATLLPMKLIFFFSFGGVAGVIPFLPLIAKQLGITATAVGIAYSAIPIFIFLSNPIVGILVDYFQNVKVFLIVLLTSCAAAYSSVLSLTPINHAIEDAVYVQISHYNNSENLVNISTPFKKACMEEIFAGGIHCEVQLKHIHLSINNYLNTATDLPRSMNITNNIDETIADSNNDDIENRHWITFYVENLTLHKTKDEVRALKSFNCSPDIDHCSASTDAISVYSTHQFWTFSTLVIIGGITWISSMTLCSVACCEILGTQMESYGRQRLFGTISSGTITSLAGILNDYSASAEKSFIPGFYLMAAFLAVDIIILCVVYIPKAHVSSNMCTDIGKIFTSKEIVVFSIGVALIGFLASIIAMYEFWFLEDMGASQTVMGLSTAVQCLLSEVPFLFLSGWFVNKFGHFVCLVISFAGFVVRFLLYSILKDPWLVLPIGLLNGVTYGIYHAAMASFVKVKAPNGMEATLLGFLGGLYDGLAYGFGSVLGGIGMDNLGPRWMFFTSSMISLVCLALFSVASYLFRTSNAGGMTRVPSEEMKEIARNE